MNREMVMPIVFGVIIIALAAGYALLLILVPLPMIIKVLAALMLVITAALMIYVLIERNREINEESKDDLSKY